MKAWLRAGLVAGICTQTIPSAKALPYAFEFGAGTGSITAPSALVQSLEGETAASASSFFSVPLTLSLQLQESQTGPLFAIALQSRYASAKSDRGTSFSLMTVSPMLRVEYWRIVLGVGYSPIALKGMGTGGRAAGIDSVLTLEGQFLFPITPEIDFGLQVARQSFSTAHDSAGSASTLDYGGFFRLNFGLSGEASSARRKFKGWRYPFGVSRH